MRAREVHRLNDIRHAGAACDEGRSTVERAVPDLPRDVVAVISGNKQLTAEALAEVRYVRAGDDGLLTVAVGDGKVGSKGRRSCKHSLIWEVCGRRPRKRRCAKGSSFHGALPKAGREHSLAPGMSQNVPRLRFGDRKATRGARRC